MMKNKIAANLIPIILCVVGILLVSVASFLDWSMRPSHADFYTFTSFADGSPLYIRKDCLCTITTVSGDVYIVPTNGSSVRVRESLNEVKKITGIK